MVSIFEYYSHIQIDTYFTFHLPIQLDNYIQKFAKYHL